MSAIVKLPIKDFDWLRILAPEMIGYADDLYQGEGFISIFFHEQAHFEDFCRQFEHTIRRFNHAETLSEESTPVAERLTLLFDRYVSGQPSEINSRR